MRRRGFLLACGLALAAALSSAGPARAEIFKWVDENSIVHYTTNRASIPIKFQDTVRIVETPPAAPPLPPLLRDAELPPLPGPGFMEEELPPPRPGSSDVTGNLLETAPPPKAEAAAPRARTASIAPPSRLDVKAYTGKGEGWWHAQFYQQQQAVDRQQTIVDTHRTRLRQIIKSHAGGEQVLPLEDDPEFQKMADILPREENRLNQLKRDLRRLQARADALRIPESWRE